MKKAHSDRVCFFSPMAFRLWPEHFFRLEDFVTNRYQINYLEVNQKFYTGFT